MFAYRHQDLDIRDTESVARVLVEDRPDWVLNASGLTDVDRAEQDPELALAVNGTAVGELARLCRDRGCALVHYSTDFVFDGTRNGCYTEDDVPAPINAYGRSKLLGEQLLRERAGTYLLVRTQWVYGLHGRAFLSTLWSRAVHRVPTGVVDDQFGGCTYAHDLAEVTWRAMSRLTGTYHVSNRGRVSRYDIAKRIFESAGAAELLQPITAAMAPSRAPRPANTPLCVERVERALGCRLAEWTDAVDRYLAAVRESAISSPAS